MSITKKPNILEGLQIGSIVFGETRKVGATVIQPGITSVDNKIQKTEDVITSNSQYVHHADQKEANFSVSGGYGVKAVAQIEAGISGAYSHESSGTSNSLSITMQRVVAAGIEYIDLNRLKPEDFIAALKGAPQDENTQDGGEKNKEPALGTGSYARMMRVINAYHNLLPDKKNPPDDKLLKKITDGTTSQDSEKNIKSVNNLLQGEGEEYFREWLEAKRSFFESEGELLVAGIVWGGWGGVKLSFDAVNSEDLLKQGVAGKFSCAGTGGSFAVSASYGHTELTEDQKKSARVTRLSHGSCVEPLVDKWEESLLNILETKINSIDKVSVGHLGSAPIPSVPEAPSFKKKPEPSKGIADKIGQLRSTDGLEALALAQAYDEHCKNYDEGDENRKTLKKFLEDAKKTNQQIKEEKANNGGDPGVDQAVVAMSNDSGSTSKDQSRASQGAGTQAKGGSDSFADFVAVGAWLVPWGQIFPWLSHVQDNNFPDDIKSSGFYKLRVLTRDLATLATTYRRLGVAYIGKEVIGADPDLIANAFKSLHARAQELQNRQASNLGNAFTADEIENEIKDILSELPDKYQKIYETWENTPLLRECELGAGMTIVGLDQKEKRPVLPISLSYSEEHNWEVKVDDLDFDKEAMNYAAFAKSIKVTPVILTNGDIVVSALWENDQKQVFSGILCSSLFKDSGCYATTAPKVTPGSSSGGVTEPQHAITFTACEKSDKDTGDKVVELIGKSYAPHTGSKKREVTFTLVPIPFEAAKNLEWIGGASSLGISDIEEDIQSIEEAMNKLPQWTFGSDYWAERDPNEPLLNLQKLKPYYVGLVEEPSLFKDSSS